MVETIADRKYWKRQQMFGRNRGSFPTISAMEISISHLARLVNSFSIRSKSPFIQQALEC